MWGTISGVLRRLAADMRKDISKDELEKLALDNEAVKRFTADGTIRKVIVVPGRLVNIVVN